MTDAQLYLAIGIPAFGPWNDRQRLFLFNALSARMTGIGNRMLALESGMRRGST